MPGNSHQLFISFKKVIEILQRTIDEYGKPLGYKNRQRTRVYFVLIPELAGQKRYRMDQEFRKENHSKMQSLSDSTALIVKTFLMQTCSFH
jgi:hypothetical protein